jgi:starvation-inducible DNA-binding protein
MADTFALYLKTHGYHWNVTGPGFMTLHKLFEEHYIEMWNSLDAYAERLRAIGAYAPGDFQALASKTIRFQAGKPPSADRMLADLLADHEAVIQGLRESIPEVADDPGTQDFLTGRVAAHEKMAWFLRSSR